MGRREIEMRMVNRATPIHVAAAYSKRARRLRRSLGAAAVVACVVDALIVTSLTPASAGSCSGVDVRHSSDLQAAIDDHPGGTTFCLAPGTYELSNPLAPKARDRFVAVDVRRAILDGGDSTTMAFDGQGVTGVTLKGLVITHFDPPADPGMAAVKAATGWRIMNTEIAYNSNTGLYHEARAIIIGNYIHNNAKIGLGGYKANDSQIMNNEVSFNGAAGGPDNGGSKWTQSVGLVIRGNFFHDNYNNAIWVDGDNMDVAITGNTVADNEAEGIQYEVSCAGVIEQNRLRGNGGSGIEIIASQHVTVRSNTVKGNAAGIVIWHQDRGNGANCAWSVRRVRIRDNVISMSQGYSGLRVYDASDGDAIFSPSDRRVRFSSNTYYLRGREQFFAWANSFCTARQWRAYGQDVDGRFVYR
jgi:hypothetical protein